MIDLSPMKGIRVDPARATVRAEAGVTGAEFDAETQAFGLATTGGVVSTTGIAGLTLGGGIGWLGRTYGLSCDNLLSADIVTADGQLRTASADENADLSGPCGAAAATSVWSHRSSTAFTTSDPRPGGSAGLATAHGARRPARVPRVHRGRARECQRLSRPGDLTDGDPSSSSSFPSRADRGGRGAVPAAAKVRAACRGHGPTDALTAAQQMLDALNPPGNRVYWKSAILATSTTTCSRRSSTEPPLSLAAVGSPHRVLWRRDQPRRRQDTAYPLRDATYALNAISAWTDPAQDDANIAWSQGLWEAMRPFSPGSVYVNFLGIGDEGDDRVKAAYGPNYARLAQIKATYDPQNLFRLNHNIRPAR